MSVDTLKIYEILAANLPEDQAKAVTKAINIAIETDTERKKDTLATKVDIANAKTEIITTMLKWMIALWLGQIGMLSGIIFAMLKLYFK